MNAWSGCGTWSRLGSAFHASEREWWEDKSVAKDDPWREDWPWQKRVESMNTLMIDLSAMKRSDVSVLIVTWEVLGVADLQSLSHSKTKRMIRLIVNPQRMKLRNCGFYSRKFAASCSTRMYPCTTFPLFVILKEIVETLLPLSKEIVKRPWIPHDRSLYSSKAAWPHLVLLRVDCSWILSLSDLSQINTNVSLEKHI